MSYSWGDASVEVERGRIYDLQPRRGASACWDHSHWLPGFKPSGKHLVHKTDITPQITERKILRQQCIIVGELPIGRSIQFLDAIGSSLCYI